jgi:transcription-repair coupling factor (superfamily II helicase)
VVPRPTTARIGGQPLRDRDLLAWARTVVDEVLLDGAAAGAGASGATAT